MPDIDEQSLFLQPKQFEQIEQLGGCNTAPEEIAIFLGIPEKEFMDEFNKPDSPLKFHYDRGILMVKSKGNMELYSSAISGNVTAIGQLDKLRMQNKFEQSKKKAQRDLEADKLDRIQRFIEHKHIDELAPAEVEYYEQLDMVRSLWQKGHTKSFIYNALLSSYKKLSYYKARQVFNDSIEFFYLDSGIKKQAWSNYYADFLDSMAKISFDMGDFNQARLLTKDAAEMRQLHIPDPPQADDGSKKIVVYTLNPETLGLPKADRSRLAKWIDSLPDIPDYGRDRLHIEVQDGKAKGNILNIPVEDVEYYEPKDENTQQ